MSFGTLCDVQGPSSGGWNGCDERAPFYYEYFLFVFCSFIGKRDASKIVVVVCRGS